MSAGPEQNPKLPAVEAAQLDFARDMHNALTDGMTPLGTSIEQDQERYGRVLFAHLAMHIAGVELPEGATPEDKARNVTEALRRIVQTPSIMESITGAQPTNAIAVFAGTELGKENTPGFKLQEKVAAAGYFSRDMLELGQSVRLDYAVPANHKRRRLGLGKVEPGQQISIRLAAEPDKVWQVVQYASAGRNLLTDQAQNFSHKVGVRQVRLDKICKMLAIESTDGTVPRQLQELTGQDVRIGQIGLGAQLRLEYDFTHAAKELRSSPEEMSFGTLSAPAHLKQAYFGTTTAYPLFPHSH